MKKMVMIFIYLSLPYFLPSRVSGMTENHEQNEDGGLANDYSAREFFFQNFDYMFMLLETIIKREDVVSNSSIHRAMVDIAHLCGVSFEIRKVCQQCLDSFLNNANFYNSSKEILLRYVLMITYKLSKKEINGIIIKNKHIDPVNLYNKINGLNTQHLLLCKSLIDDLAELNNKSLISLFFQRLDVLFSYLEGSGQFFSQKSDFSYWNILKFAVMTGSVTMVQEVLSWLKARQISMGWLLAQSDDHNRRILFFAVQSDMAEVVDLIVNVLCAAYEDEETIRMYLQSELVVALVKRKKNLRIAQLLDIALG